MGDNIKRTVREKSSEESASEICKEFDFEQADEAIAALQEYAVQTGSNSKKSGLFSEDRPVYLEVVMKKYPVHLPPVVFLEILLPHPFHDPQTASSCIFVRDLDKRPTREDREKASGIYKDFFSEKQHLTEFSEVISMKQLLTEYKTYEARRQLCNSYEVFIADVRVAEQITRWLGKVFIEQKKIPFRINVTKRVKKSFLRVFKLTRTIFTPNTLKFAVKIGRLNQPADHLLSNMRAVLEHLALRMPGKWRNVRSAYLSAPSLVELPVYVDWGSSNDIIFPKSLKTEPRFVEGELTTLAVDSDAEEKPAPNVRVFDDGTVRVGKADNKEQRETYWDPPRKRYSKVKTSKSKRLRRGTRSGSKVKAEMKVEPKPEET